MDDVERLTAWSYRRQMLLEPARTLGAALSGVTAVYATHPTAPLALWARAASFSPARYRRLDRDARAVRIPAMRNTVFLVPRRDAARTFTAVRPTAAHARRGLKRIGMAERDYETAARRILKAARAPVTTRDLASPAGIEGQELATVLRALRYEGRLLTIAGDSLSSSPHHYVAAETLMPEGLDSGDVDAARAWLAGSYLRGYGPARVEDFAWWSGLTKSVATKALESHRTVDVGDGLLLAAKDEGDFANVKRLRGEVCLLPKWDAYTMGHAPDGRHRLVDPDAQAAVYTPIGVGLPGDGNPIVLVEGKAVATWTFTQKEGTAVQPFDGLGGRTRRRVDELLQTVAGLLTR